MFWCLSDISKLFVITTLMINFSNGKNIRDDDNSFVSPMLMNKLSWTEENSEHTLIDNEVNEDDRECSSKYKDYLSYEYNFLPQNFEMIPGLPLFNTHFNDRISLGGNNSNISIPEHPTIGTDPTGFLFSFRKVRKEFLAIHDYFLPKRRIFDDEEDFAERLLDKQCQSDVNAIHDRFLEPRFPQNRRDEIDFNPQFWALKLFDSWGKSADGGLVGNVAYPGFMKECLSVNTKDAEIGPELDFTGKFCLITTELLPLETNDTFSGILPPLYATCIPSSCSEEDLKNGLSRKYEEAHHKITGITCHLDPYKQEWDAWAIISVCMMCLMIAPVVAATIIHLFTNRFPAWLKAFSAVENTSKLFSVRMNIPGDISCMHGIRVFSICWVVLGHYFSLIPATASNRLEVYNEIQESWRTQIVWSGYRAVDTFFVLGGLLVTRSLLSRNFCIEKKHNSGVNVEETCAGEPEVDIEKNEDVTASDESQDEQNKEPSISSSSSVKNNLKEQIHSKDDGMMNQFFDMESWKEVQLQGYNRTALAFLKNYLIFIVHRYIRLVPAIFFCTMFLIGVTPMLAGGPFGQGYRDGFVEQCKNNWWMDLTLFTNVIYKLKVDRCLYEGECTNLSSCFSQCWYLGVDFQLYLATPFLILPMKLINRKVAYLVLIILGSCIIPGAMIVANGYYAAYFISADWRDPFLYFLEIYIIPYARSGPYFVGCLCALLLHYADNAKKRGETPGWLRLLSNKYVLTAGWALNTALALTIMFGLVKVNKLSVNPAEQHLGPFLDFLYGGFACGLWGLVVGWVILVCQLQLAGPVNFFLSHPMFQPLSRLSYMVFLIHIVGIYIIGFNVTYQLFYVTRLLILLTWCGILTINFLFAIGFTLVGEAPYINLLKFIKK